MPERIKIIKSSIGNVDYNTVIIMYGIRWVLDLLR